MDDEVETATDSDAKLAKWEKILGDLLMVNGHNEGADNTAKGSADADGAKFGKIVRSL